VSTRLRGPYLTILGSRVARPVVLLVDDGDGELAATLRILSIAVAYCPTCKGRFRVLPSDVLPHKRYGLAMIATTAAAHAVANNSLRAAAWQTHTGQTPAHTTLHAWTEGLGAFVLGRPFGGLPGAHPFQAVVAATKARWSALTTAPLPPSRIDPRRYRTEARRERLHAIADVLALARVVTAVATADLDIDANRVPLCSWRRLAIDIGIPAPLLFRTGIRCTPSEHVVAADPESPGLPQPTGDSVCQTRSRSPPSASSRSRPSSTPPSIPPSGGT
jgi:hypothetical protein